MAAAKSFIRYGVEWPSTFTDLQVEFYCIQQGGKWTEHGREFGLGLFEHYRNAQRLAWPEDDEHRWSNLSLKTIVDNEVSVFAGCSDANKTYSISKFVMIDWWSFPEKTLWMVSSTELRGAELRVWGTLKQLFNRARLLHPDLPGRVLEAQHAITTEEIDESQKKSRLLTKGLIFIPCFPVGTLVDTPAGVVPIENITPGDVVIGACGAQIVNDISSRIAPQLVRITLRDGRIIDCTPEHPILTNQGWKNAIAIKPQDSVLSVNDTLRVLREGVSKAKTQPEVLLPSVPDFRDAEEVFGLREDICSIQSKGETLFETLCREIELDAQPREPFEGNSTKRLGCYRGQNERHRHGEPIRTPEETGKAEIDVEQAGSEWRESLQWHWSWPRPNQIRSSAYSPIPRRNLQPINSHWDGIKEASTPRILFGLGVALNQIRRGGRWQIPRFECSTEEGCAEGSIPEGIGVDSIEILRPESDPRYDKDKGGYLVHNLEVGTHPSYSVNGVIVHNCKSNGRWVGMGTFSGVKGGSLNARLGHFGDEVAAMQPSFLDAYANWYGKENFKGIMSGNPFDLEDCLCRAAEPVDGWPSWKDTEKTQTWRSKFYNAAVVAFDGRDSPNLDVPEGQKTPYPYLIGRKKLKAVEKMHGKDSWQYSSQCTGKPRPGSMMRRVINRQLCDEYGAWDDVVWSGKPTIKIGACDAAYGGVGGDDCIAGYVEFGEDVDGNTVLACNPPVLVPVSVTKKGLPEEQIAHFIKDYCESVGIPPENFFFDARSTMAITFARIWSPMVNVVDFGSPTTDRPVSMDTFIWDGDTQTRRLQQCKELYSKFVTELWYSIHYVILSRQMRRFPMEVAEEGFKREWKYVKGNRIEVETKADMKLRTGHSPDRCDWFATALEGARRRGFEIKSMAKERQESTNDFWLEHALEKHNKWAKRHELKYA